MTDPDPTEPTTPVDVGRADTGQFVVAPAHPTAPPGRSAAWTFVGAFAAVAVVALTAWGLAGQGSPPPAAARPVPAAAAPSPTGPTMPVVDVATSEEALDELARLAGWGGCPVWRSFDVAATVAPREVEAAIRGQAQAHGLIDVPDAAGASQRVWVGGEVEVAARGFGGTFVVREPDAAWTVVPWGTGEAAVRLKPTARRDGGAFWQISGRAAPAPYCLDRTVQVDGPVRVLHVAGDAQKGVFEAAGFAGCKTWRRDASQTVPTSAAIEAAAAAELILPGGHGWIDLPAAAVGGDRPMRAWLGSDEHAAAAAHGSNLMVVGDAEPAGPWLLVSLDDRPAAIQLLRTETTGGWDAWLPTRNAAGLTRASDGTPDGCGATTP